MAPNVDETDPRMLDLMILAKAPDVDETDPRIIDLTIFWP